jgi:hypothetical protein
VTVLGVLILFGWFAVLLVAWAMCRAAAAGDAHLDVLPPEVGGSPVVALGADPSPPSAGRDDAAAGKRA